MKTRILSLACSLGLACCFALSAQTADSQSTPADGSARHGGRFAADPARQIQMLSKRLNLSSDQTAQLQPILADRAEKMKALFANSSLSREDRRSQMMTIMQDTDAKIKGVLTADQKQKYDAMQEKRRERMQERMQNHKQNNNDQNSSL